MATAKRVDKETKVSFKFSRFVDEYDFDILFDIEDIEAGIIEIKKLIDSFEGIHVELKRELGDRYQETYPNFAEKLKPMTEWVKNAKLEIKKQKLEKLKQEREKEEKKERLRKEKEGKEEKLRVEREEKEDRLRKEREEREEHKREMEKPDQLRKEMEMRVESEQGEGEIENCAKALEQEDRARCSKY